MSATVQLLPGGRLHLQHGPIDVILRAWADPAAVERAHAAAAARFSTILDELVAELPGLRAPAGAPVRGPVARRMAAAVAGFDEFVTPMAAVAGAVADELLDVMRGAAALQKAYVNDGGDIALHLAPGEGLRIGVAADFSRGPVPAIDGAVLLRGEDGIGGVATSGFQGRSFSLGIADAVTVLAATAARADAAATLVANAVDVDSPAIARRPARDLDPDSDLGARAVTVAVGPLSEAEIEAALARGAARAERFRAAGVLAAAALTLRGRTRIVGAAAARPLALECR